MTCKEAIALLADYLETTLSSEALAELEAHFHDCPPCVAYLNTYKRTRDLVGHHGRVELPDEMKDRLRSFLLEQLRRPQP